MSGTYPSTAFTAVNFKINTPTLQTQTNSGMTRRVGMGHSYYSFTINHAPLTPYEYGPIVGFISQQYGPLESFQVVLPELSYSKATNQVTTTVSTNAAAARGIDYVSIPAVASGKTLLRAGDFFKFANHSKVYMCAVSCVAGDTQLFFSGSLVKDVPSGTNLVIDAVPFTVIMTNEVQQFEVGMGGMTKLELDVREVW